MKPWLKCLEIMLCAGLLLTLFGCSNNPADTTVPSTAPTQPPLSALEQYELAQVEINGADNLILTYTISEDRRINGDSYTETVSGSASFSNVGQDSMTAVVEESLQYGAYDSAYTEIYCEGAAFVQVNDSYFSASLTAQEFVDRQLPAVLLDGSLYASVSAQHQEDTTVISFTDAAGLENWMEGAGEAELIYAEGTAILDSTGTLVQTAYQAEFIWGAARYTCDVTVRVTAPKSLDLGARHSEHFQNSPVLADIGVPKILLKVVGDVYSSQSMSCDALEAIYSEAIPAAYTQKSKYYLTGSEETLKAGAEYVITLSDYRGDISTKTQVDSFQDGVFTTVSNGGKPVQQTEVTAQAMRQYCEDAILSAVFAPKYLSEAVLRDDGDHYYLELQGNDAFASDLMTGIVQFLQADLDAQAEAFKTTEAGGYVTIDKATGLPVSAGLSFVRLHILDSVLYQLTYRLDQTLVISEITSGQTDIEQP